MTLHRFSLILITLVAVLVLVLGWFVGISPQLERINSADSQREELVASNAVEEQELQQLVELNEQLPELQSQLEELRVSIPEEYLQSTVIRTIDELAQASGVSVDSVTVGDIAAYEQGESEAAADLGANTLVTVGLSLSLSGTDDANQAFLTNLQGEERIFLVTDVQQSGADDGYTMTITATLWMLQASETADSAQSG